MISKRIFKSLFYYQLHLVYNESVNQEKAQSYWSHRSWACLRIGCMHSDGLRSAEWEILSLTLGGVLQHYAFLFSFETKLPSVYLLTAAAAVLLCSFEAASKWVAGSMAEPSLPLSESRSYSWDSYSASFELYSSLSHPNFETYWSSPIATTSLVIALRGLALFYLKLDLWATLFQSVLLLYPFAKVYPVECLRPQDALEQIFSSQVEVVESPDMPHSTFYGAHHSRACSLKVSSDSKMYLTAG